MRAAVEDPDPQAIVRYKQAKREERVKHKALHDPGAAELLRAALDSAPHGPMEQHSGECGSLIIHAIETNQPQVIYGNVPNHRLIDNLPSGCCVEVPCLVDANGVQPTRVGALTPQLATLIQTNINVQALRVEAVLTEKREHIYHAADEEFAGNADWHQLEVRIQLVDLRVSDRTTDWQQMPVARTYLQRRADRGLRRTVGVDEAPSLPPAGRNLPCGNTC